jgi:hypothetical protein
MPFKLLEQVKSQISRLQKMIKIRAVIIVTKRTIQKIKEVKRWFLEKINKIVKPLARQTYTEINGIE